MYASNLTQKGDLDWMNLQDCPYCNLPGLITTIKPTSGGVEVLGKCTICGYSYDSDYSPNEQSDDLPGEYSRSLETAAAD
jgi:hypothetical protein